MAAHGRDVPGGIPAIRVALDTTPLRQTRAGTARYVRGLRDQGMGIVVVSTEPETVLSLADRILVMKKGEIVREFASQTVSKDRLLEAA